MVVGTVGVRGRLGGRRLGKLAGMDDLPEPRPPLDLGRLCLAGARLARYALGQQERDADQRARRQWLRDQYARPARAQVNQRALQAPPLRAGLLHLQRHRRDVVVQPGKAPV
jgi:hypothetical protein